MSRKAELPPPQKQRQPALTKICAVPIDKDLGLRQVQEAYSQGTFFCEIVFRMLTKTQKSGRFLPASERTEYNGPVDVGKFLVSNNSLFKSLRFCIY